MYGAAVSMCVAYSSVAWSKVAHWEREEKREWEAVRELTRSVTLLLS